MVDHGITTQQWAVLGALARPPVRERGMSVKALIEYLMLSRQNLTAVLGRLETRGLLQRAIDPEDARSRLIRLSPEGEALWLKMQTRIATFYTGALEGLSADEAAQLFMLLDRLRNGLDGV
jgi:DNA-binding MarR family transcriptional regulator